MVTFSQLLSLDVNGLDTFVRDWGDVHKRIKDNRKDFHDEVVTPLHKDRWRGEAGRAAQAYCDRIQLDFDALDTEVQGLRSFFRDEVNGTGGGSGFAGLRDLQGQAEALRLEAAEDGMLITDDASVSWSDMYDPNNPEGLARHKERRGKAESLEQRARAVLEKADAEDGWISQNIKVVFGTPHNFESENRDFDILNPDGSDRTTRNKLNNVGALANARGWVNTAGLIKHYLDATGAPVEVDPQELLDDIPQFRRDANTTLAQDVAHRPDGSFTTAWQSTAPRPGDGGESQDWYYALNHFQYRMVGEKQGNTVTYHMEVKKRYDWGVPSEHRTTQSKGYGPLKITLEQADIAHLNTTGVARDFDVTGTSGQMRATL
ncbi:hypothetical protein [Streptomyces sp. NBC_01497]|uniref:hypothetical protein n=1 Tax=Streptomyces sp. NBC_01497 TaxID=2903885 RepID=UPI002E31DDB5|nr:hypothetical protein [Streptomyces sp. NBC_01497]